MQSSNGRRGVYRTLRKTSLRRLWQSRDEAHADVHPFELEVRTKIDVGFVVAGVLFVGEDRYFGRRERELLDRIDRNPSPLSAIASRLAADGGWNFGKQLEVIRIGHLECVDEPFSAGHINAFAVAVEIEVIRVLDARRRGHLPA